MLKRSKKRHIVKIFKMLSDARQLEILHSIMLLEKTVEIISQETKMGKGRVISELKKMCSNGTVSAKSKGGEMHYTMRDIKVMKILGVANLK